MNYTELVRPEVLTQPVYEPGLPIEVVAQEFGLEPASIVKLASNENPMGPSPLALEAVRRTLRDGHRYPDGSAWALREKLAARHELEAGQILIGNGSNEIMVLLCQALLRPGDEAVIGAQAFIALKLSVLLAGATPVMVPMPGLCHDLDAMAAAVTERTRLVYLPSPNNPTGDTHSQEAIERLVRKLPENVVFLFDEAYAEYLESPPDLRPLLAAGHKVVGCRTFSKIFGLAAYRVGYAYGSAELMGLLGRIRQPFNVNALGQTAALAALDDQAHIECSLEANRNGMIQLRALADRLDLSLITSPANFGLLEVVNAPAVFDRLRRQGVIVRPLGGYGLPSHLRISVGTKHELERLEAALGKVSEEAPELLHRNRVVSQ